MFHSQNNERRYSSVVEHTLGKGGVVSPILTSGTIFDISAQVADFFVFKQCFIQSDFMRFIEVLFSLLIGLFAKT